MEVEVKFSIPDRETFDQLVQLDEWAGYRLESVGIKRVRDSYFDTDDRAILNAGFACRVREVEGNRIATLKGLGGVDAESGIHQREEHEVPVELDDPRTWPDSPARDLALRLTIGRPLTELFSLSQERHIRLLSEEGSEGTRRVAELSLDVVTHALGQGGTPRSYYELEVELLEQGNKGDLQTLAHDLKVAWGLRPEPRSKFERGLALIDAVPRRQ